MLFLPENFIYLTSLYRNVSHDQRRSLLLVLLVLVSVLYPLLAPSSAHAALIATNGYVRPDRHAATLTTPTTICMKPSVTHTTSVSIFAVTFPTGFTVSTSTPATTWLASNPAGMPGTIMPGIIASTPSVSGQTVTWTMGSNQTLTGGTLYCFYVATAASLTNPAAGNDKTGTLNLTDTTPANSEVTNFAMSVISGTTDQLTVTATVGSTFTFQQTVAGNHALGALNSTGATSSPTASTYSVATNARTGWIAWMKSAGAALTSAATSASIGGTSYVNSGSNIIDLSSTPGSNYVVDAQVGVTTTINPAFLGNNTTSGGRPSTAFVQLASDASQTAGDTFTIKARARVLATQAAATDYTDTLTIVAAGQF